MHVSVPSFFSNVVTDKYENFSTGMHLSAESSSGLAYVLQITPGEKLFQKPLEL